jgi:hypothetical protein
MRNITPCLSLVALLVFSRATFAASPAGSAAGFQPIAAGALADVNAKDGDAAFNTDYFASADLSGPVATSRLEGDVGGARTMATGLGAGGYSVRWSATLTPKVSGTFPIALRSIGAAELAIDGKVVLRHDATRNDFGVRSVAKLALAANKPYELVVEWRNPTGQGRIAAEWAEPAPLGPAAESAVRVETQAGPAAGMVIGTRSIRENGTYSLTTQTDGSLLLLEKSSGVQAVFRPEFVVVHQRPGNETKMDPKGGKYQDSGPVGDTNYVVPSWNKETDFLAAAHPRTRLRAMAVVESGPKLRWEFPEHPDFSLSAEVWLPAGGAPPALGFRLRAKTPGQFSVGYVGAPEVTAEAADWIWQPLIWTGKRFPNRSYFTKEFQCPIPWVMTGVGSSAVGVGADPVEMPYRMPTITDSRFGVLVRNAAGRAQPMLFAPVLGGPESALAAGANYGFTLRLLVRQGSWFDAFKHLARSTYALGDVRENALCSLNTTIDNFMAFLLDERFSYWFPRYKTWGYQNDGGPGAGRQQSAADAVSLALVCDSAAFLRERARPTLEYMLSRNSVSTNFAQGKFMGGHVNNATDLGAAYRLTGGRTTVVRELFAGQASRADAAKRAPSPGRNEIYVARHELTAQLAEYRLTGERAALGQARRAADRYITLRVDRPAQNFKDVGSSFWHELAAAYDLLYELYQETGDVRYLRAATAAMQEFTAYIYLVPVIPTGDFVAQPGGRYNNQPVPEEIVPAWRVSPNGLTAECAGTAHSHRGVYMASYPSYLARLARDTGETFFRDIARHAIVGRYANYPSYAYRNGFTTVHQQPDYPLRSFEEIKKFTSAHYNHPLPMAAFLVDYLVSEAYLRSDGAIDFPSDYTNTGAFFRNKVYGARAGRFYGESGVYFWLPKRLVNADSAQLNYVAARGNGRLYLAFANQAPRAVTSTIMIDPARVTVPGAHHARTWTNNQPDAGTTVIDGRVTITVPPKGLVGLAIDGAACTTEIQEAMLDPAAAPLPAGSTATVRTTAGDVTATALRFGRGLTSVHVWLKAGPATVQRARLSWTDGGQARHADCAEFPFEFTVPVADAEAVFRGEVAIWAVGGKALPSVALAVPLSAR